MPRLIGLILAVALCGACPHGARNQRIVTPSGEKAFAVSCEHLDRCYVLAGKDCPSGYHRINGNEDEDEATLRINGVDARARAGKQHTWIIKCN